MDIEVLSVHMSTVIFNGYNGHECGLPCDELAETET
jgi:hypothetical protein